MPSLQEIGRQITAIKDRYIFFTEKEIRYLPEIMGENERILGCTSGFVSKSTWLGVCTNKRVLFINCGMVYGVHQVQMNLDRIQSINSTQGLFFGAIRVWDGASSIAINMVLKRSIAPFVRTVQDAMDQYKRRFIQEAVASGNHNAPQAPAAQSPSPQAPTAQAAPQRSVKTTEDLIKELERISALNQQGALSDEEFHLAKTALLAEQRQG